jgi:hypothetical protein
MRGKITSNRLMKAIVIFMALTGLLPLVRYGANYFKLNLDTYRTFHNNVKPLIPIDSRLLSPNHIQPQFLKVRYSGILMGSYSLQYKPDYIILANDRIPTFWQKEEYLEFVKEQKSKCQILYEDKKLAVLKTNTAK